MTLQKRFPTLSVLDHPLIQHKLGLMREASCPTLQFRQLLREISLLMGYEITRDLPLDEQSIETPVAPTTVRRLAGKKLAVVPILRAGLGMADALVELVPSARVGHIGLYRDEETHRPHEYFVKLPSPEDRLFILADPMIGTGHSAAHAVTVVKRHGVPGHAIRFLALVAAPEGMEVLAAAHPDVPVFVAALDDHLNDHAYIIPGLGDAGDRLFGTR